MQSLIKLWTQDERTIERERKININLKDKISNLYFYFNERDPLDSVWNIQNKDLSLNSFSGKESKLNKKKNIFLFTAVYLYARVREKNVLLLYEMQPNFRAYILFIYMCVELSVVLLFY